MEVRKHFMGKYPLKYTKKTTDSWLKKKKKLLNPWAYLKF